jgi:hypothetical protein
MEWITGSAAARISVVVPDDLVLDLIDAVDVPRGSTGIDPYRDSEFRGPHLVTLRDNAARAGEARRTLVRSEILDQLHRAHVEAWMEDMIATRERSDRMLAKLEELKTLLDLAILEGASVHVLGD